MDKKLKKAKDKKLIVKKKFYTPPTLTVYGKLTELTAGGTQGNPEGASGHPDKAPRP